MPASAYYSATKEVEHVGDPIYVTTRSNRTLAMQCSPHDREGAI